ncbi:MULTISPECIES: hypothetical protein [unclassified Bradyrhizobium]|nr:MULTISPECIES: hypothetical protein [unclassified Bradyrhizobium]
MTWIKDPAQSSLRFAVTASAKEAISRAVQTLEAISESLALASSN